MSSNQNLSHACPRGKGNWGLTVMELMVSMIVLAVLGLLMLTGMRNFRQQAQGAKCIGNLRQIGAATHVYLADNRGFLPLAAEKNLISGSSVWDGENFGAWYWQLAPYLGVERWNTIRKYLGPQGEYLYGPIVYTCPSHGNQERVPLSYPSRQPVSYAPSTRLSPSEVTTRYESYELRRLHLSQISRPSEKIWISDSTWANILNVSVRRWQVDIPDSEAWARVSFSRHAGAGKALFFDGHVERIPYRSIADENLARRLDQLFDPEF